MPAQHEIAEGLRFDSFALGYDENPGQCPIRTRVREEAVELIARLGNETWTCAAIEHWAIIDRFGRFPSRNAILGRNSSADEVAMLQQSAPF